MIQIYSDIECKHFQALSNRTLYPSQIIIFPCALCSMALWHRKQSSPSFPFGELSDDLMSLVIGFITKQNDKTATCVRIAKVTT